MKNMFSLIMSILNEEQKKFDVINYIKEQLNFDLKQYVVKEFVKKGKKYIIVNYEEMNDSTNVIRQIESYGIIGPKKYAIEPNGYLKIAIVVLK